MNLIQVYADIMKTKQHETFFVIWAEDLEFSRSFHAIPINQPLGDTFKKIYNEAHANSLLTGIICPNAFEKQANMSKDALALLENLFIGDTCFATFIRGDNPERAHQLLDGVTRQDRIVQRDYLNKIKYP